MITATESICGIATLYSPRTVDILPRLRCNSNDFNQGDERDVGTSRINAIGEVENLPSTRTCPVDLLDNSSPYSSYCTSRIYLEFCNPRFMIQIYFCNFPVADCPAFS